MTRQPYRIPDGATLSKASKTLRDKMVLRYIEAWFFLAPADPFPRTAEARRALHHSHMGATGSPTGGISRSKYNNRLYTHEPRHMCDSRILPDKKSRPCEYSGNREKIEALQDDRWLHT